jgi:hypothetical protein
MDVTPEGATQASAPTAVNEMIVSAMIRLSR